MHRTPGLPGLAKALGATLADDDPSAFAIDGLAPAAVVRPADYHAVSTALSFANDRGLAVIPYGGGQHSHIGNSARRYDLAVDMKALDSVVEFEPADLTITVEAGMTLGQLRGVTAAEGRFVPFEPSAPDGSTVGGMIAAAVAGPAQHWLGTPRDFTIGLRVVAGDGRMSRAGGRVVKNVAGYDLCKLYTGSFGTLGVIVEASLKALPQPLASEDLYFAADSPDTTCHVVHSALQKGLSVRSASSRAGAEGWLTHLTLAGTRAGVERSRAQIAAEPGIAIRDSGAAAATETMGVEVMLRMLQSRLPTAMLWAQGVREVSAEAWPASGVLIVRSDDAEHLLRVTRDVAREHDAAMTVIRCPAGVKESIDMFGENERTRSLAERIKSEFDPGGTLSPGRGPGRL